ncbi:BnaA01g24180D [Brassica napus]|uniref:BnaA01g24180D protein n=3 Tax=Brassica TaxID=3705 RepID=A0A078HDI0_BRANA|nr:BnaA01g24180D [Brassica napus]VDC76828.1 unnamed protein product [Brassica rapa]
MFITEVLSITRACAKKRFYFNIWCWSIFMELFEEFRAMLSQKRMCIVLWSEKNVQAIKRGCRRILEMVLEAGHRGRSITLILEDQLKKSQVAERPTGRSTGAYELERAVKTAATRTDIGGTDHSKVRKLLHDLISATSKTRHRSDLSERRSKETMDLVTTRASVWSGFTRLLLDFRHFEFYLVYGFVQIC